MAKGPSTIFTLPGTLEGGAFCFVVIFGDGVRDAVCALALRPGLRPCLVLGDAVWALALRPGLRCCLGETLPPILSGEIPPEEHGDGNGETGDNRGCFEEVPKILKMAEEKKEKIQTKARMNPCIGPVLAILPSILELFFTVSEGSALSGEFPLFFLLLTGEFCFMGGC